LDFSALRYQPPAAADFIEKEAGLQKKSGAIRLVMNNAKAR